MISARIKPWDKILKKLTLITHLGMRRYAQFLTFLLSSKSM